MPVTIARSMRGAVASPLFAAAVATIATALFASPVAAQGMRFGTLAGPAFTSITDLDKSADLGMDLLTSKSRIGLQGGLFATIPVKGALSLQPEVHYSQKGGKLETSMELPESAGEETAKLGFRLAYVEIPVLARIDLGNRSGWHPFVSFGPAFSMRAACKVSLEVAGSGSLSTSCDEGDLGEGEAASRDPFSKTDISGIAGAGLTGSLLGRSVFVQARYSQGFSSIAKESSADISPKNRGFSVVFGLGF
ncbi:MAG TPA: porin family protein [Gemmatimonas sp.]|uniref:porin family protein n=1 Tax=Gemmatimonas sp. TaxID=1962908 RepID=UPI002ED82BF0